MVTVNYVGHSTFILESDGKTVLLDPWFTGNPVAKVGADSVNPDVILVSHAHSDHIGDAAGIAIRSGAKVIAIVETAEYLNRKGVENIEPGNFGGTIDFDGGSAKFVPAWHTSSFTEDGKKVAIGIPAGLIIRFGGSTIYFAGDTALFGDMALIGEEGLDLAIIPIGGHYTMDPADATRAAKLLNAKKVMPCHFNTFPAIQQDAQKFKDDVEARTSSQVVVLAPGESFDFA